MATLIVAFCIVYPLWTWSASLGLNFSLTAALGTLSVAGAAVAVLRSARSGDFRLPPKHLYVPMLIIVIWTVCVGFLNVVLRLAILKDVILSAWLALFPVALVSLPTMVGGSVVDGKRSLRLIAIFAALDVAVSSAQYFLLSTGHLTTLSFWRNSKLNSIIMGGSVRIPGLFNNAGSNAYFLSIVAIGLVSFAYQRSRARGRAQVQAWAWIAALVVVSVVAATLTRKAYVVSVLLVPLLLSRLARSGARRTVLLLIVGFCLTIAPFIAAERSARGSPRSAGSTSVTSATSFDERLSEWASALDYLSTHPVDLLIGTGLSQQAATFGTVLPVTVVDNMLFSLVLFGGLPFVVLYAWLFTAMMRGLRWSGIRDSRRSWLHWTLRTALWGLLVFGLFAVAWNDIGLTYLLYLMTGVAVSAGKGTPGHAARLKGLPQARTKTFAAESGHATPY